MNVTWWVVSETLLKGSYSYMIICHARIFGSLNFTFSFPIDCFRQEILEQYLQNTHANDNLLSILDERQYIEYFHFEQHK